MSRRTAMVTVSPAGRAIGTISRPEAAPPATGGTVRNSAHEIRVSCCAGASRSNIASSMSSRTFAPVLRTRYSTITALAAHGASTRRGNFNHLWYKTAALADPDESGHAAFPAGGRDGAARRERSEG